MAIPTEILEVTDYTDREIRLQVVKIGVVLDEGVPVEAVNRYVTVADKKYASYVKKQKLDVDDLTEPVTDEVKDMIMYYSSWRCCIDSITDQPAPGNLNQLQQKDKWREKAELYKELYEDALGNLVPSDFVDNPAPEDDVNEYFIAEGIRR